MFAMDIRILWKLNFKEEIYFPLLLAYFFFHEETFFNYSANFSKKK